MIMEICKGFESCCCRHIPFASDYTGLDTDECKKKSVSHSSEHGPRSSSPLFRKSVPSGTPEVEETPSGFPFEIQDNPGQQTITLKRKYQGEVIEVEVQMPDLEPGEEGVDNDDDDDDSEKGSQSSIPLVVSVSKKNGLCLEFSVTALHDEISIDNLAIKDPENSEDQIAYEGPDFLDLDENLQKAFHKYLEIRGIKPSTTNFLHEYMMNKGGREYVIWLKNLKKFVEA